jgi:TrmH family RNA methyltransferase
MSTLPDVPLKTYRKEFDHSYSFGVFPTVELIERRPEAALKVLLSKAGRKNRGVAKIEQLCERLGVRVEVNDRAVERLAPRENAYAVGVFRKYECDLDPAAPHVALVNPSDMGNLGTIMRTMLGFGVRNLALVRPAADVFDPRVVRSSMGALFGISFRYFDTWEDYAEHFLRTYYPFMTGGTLMLREARFERPYTLVFGSESAGLPEEFRSRGTPVTIPQSSEIDSLNLTIAVAIALYEAARQQEERTR